MHNKPYTIALIGFANSGKTTLFNHLTGSNYKTVNYPGSTVDFIKGPLLKNADITVLDIPGINSLNPRSIDEQIAITSLSSLKSLIHSDRNVPDLIISVVDSTQRTRHLQLTKQLIDSGFNVLIALTMSDVAKKEGKTLDTQALSRKLKCPIIRFNGRSGAGLKRLSSKCLEVITKSQAPSPTIIQRSQLDIISDFNWASSTLKETKKDSLKLKKSIDGDTLLLHWALGPICFASIMSLFFYSIFALAGPLMDAIDIFFTSSASLLSNVLPSNIISTILIDGIWTGIGSVAVFIPQIAILFLGIGLLESSGYLARGAMIMDKFLSKVHLSGRSFVPLLSGCACAIPAMMAARNIPNEKERLLCMFIIPLMQCSARLPVYGVLLSLLFNHNPLYSGIGLTSIYLLSLVIAGIVAKLTAKKLDLKANNSYFSMELPKWKMPVWTHLFYHVYEQCKAFIKGAGPIIIGLAIALWTLSTFPNPDNSFAMMIGQVIEPIFSPMGLDWRVGVAILLSFAAREIFVSVLVLLFTLSGSEDSLLGALEAATFTGSNTAIFTTSTIIGLLLFFMIAMQCMATLAIAKKEMGSWKLPQIQAIVYTVLAYGLSVIAVQGLRLFGLH